MHQAMDDDDFVWTTGRELGVSHLSKIAIGAFGEVHKVLLSYIECNLTQQMSRWKETAEEVNFLFKDVPIGE
jgi:hypothetical protein